ncbi:hypothetical protein [Paracoccus sp. (in: a-proteobacteria)]|uniref:hypothetical protein n=1 Tax=Paracoccus sp. TaxID=267 RepID=UPI00396CE2D3
MPVLSLLSPPTGGKSTSYTAATKAARDPSGYRETLQVASVVNDNLRLTSQTDMMWPRANWPLNNLLAKPTRSTLAM